ncbi:PAS domain-containing protein [Enterocloster clostridioformis]|uniref:PAS domain-containing protein n=1 Tax=Enterocloster clostridioformis TaxID=1531 RepID=UPI003A7F5A5C
MNSLDYGLCLADTNQRITIVNKQLTKLLNHSEQDLIGKRVDEIFYPPPNRRLSWRRYYDSKIQTGGPAYPFFHKDDYHSDTRRYPQLCSSGFALLQ